MILFQELGLDYDMVEEDQMMRAIAMSLGQDMPPAAAPAVDQVQIQYNLCVVIIISIVGIYSSIA